MSPTQEHQSTQREQRECGRFGDDGKETVSVAAVPVGPDDIVTVDALDVSVIPIHRKCGVGVDGVQQSNNGDSKKVDANRLAELLRAVTALAVPTESALEDY